MGETGRYSLAHVSYSRLRRVGLSYANPWSISAATEVRISIEITQDLTIRVDISWSYQLEVCL